MNRIHSRNLQRIAAELLRPAFRPSALRSAIVQLRVDLGVELEDGTTNQRAIAKVKLLTSQALHNAWRVGITCASCTGLTALCTLQK